MAQDPKMNELGRRRKQSWNKCGYPRCCLGNKMMVLDTMEHIIALWISLARIHFILIKNIANVGPCE